MQAFEVDNSQVKDKDAAQSPSSGGSSSSSDSDSSDSEDGDKDNTPRSGTSEGSKRRTAVSQASAPRGSGIMQANGLVNKLKA